MDNLISLVSSKLKVGTVYVVWEHSHAVTMITGEKRSERNSYFYSIINARKYYVPHMWRSYKVDENEFVRDPKQKFSESLLTERYYTYDGKMLSKLSGKSMQSVLYKNTKYYNEIVSCMRDQTFMSKWLVDENLRGQMLYKTLKMIIRARINPDFRCESTKFNNETKEKVRKNWKMTPGTMNRMKTTNVMVMKDVLGLYVVGNSDKEKHFSNVSFVNKYCIEHIVSDCYGASSTDYNNGIPLDAVINMSKGHTMLFLINQRTRDKIIEQKRLQTEYFKGKLYLC